MFFNYFLALLKGITPKIRMLCFVLTNSVLLNLLDLAYRLHEIECPSVRKICRNGFRLSDSSTTRLGSPVSEISPKGNDSEMSVGLKWQSKEWCVLFARLDWLIASVTQSSVTR